MKRLLAFLLLPAIAACGDDGADMDFGGEDLGPDRFAIHSEDGSVQMGLTQDFLYFALSDSVIAAARAEMDEDSTRREGIGGAIAGLVRGGVDRALRFRARYDVADIRDVRWEDGRMVVDFVDPDHSLSTNFEVDDRPIEEVFSQQDVEAFRQQLRDLKRERGEGGPAGGR